jgi:hypothetical protein
MRTRDVLPFPYYIVSVVQFLHGYGLNRNQVFFISHKTHQRNISTPSQSNHHDLTSSYQGSYISFKRTYRIVYQCHQQVSIGREAGTSTFGTSSIDLIFGRTRFAKRVFFAIQHRIVKIMTFITLSLLVLSLYFQLSTILHHHSYYMIQELYINSCPIQSYNTFQLCTYNCTSTW